MTLSVLPQAPGTGVHVALLDFGLGGVGQEGKQTASSISLTIQYQSRDGWDVAIADRFEGNRRAFRELGEEGRNGPRCVADPPLLNERSNLIQACKDGEVFASPFGLARESTTADRIIEVNNAAPPVLNGKLDISILAGGAVLSSNHLAACSGAGQGIGRGLLGDSWPGQSSLGVTQDGRTIASKGCSVARADTLKERGTSQLKGVGHPPLYFSFMCCYIGNQ